MAPALAACHGCVLLVCSFATMAFGGSYVGYDSVRFLSSVLFLTVTLRGVFVHTAILILLGRH